MILKTKQEGRSVISSNNEKILLNDRNGSETKIKRAPLGLNIIEKTSKETFTSLYDSTPPESFVLQISKDQSIFNGKHFLAFATQDKGSGIDYYEIMEKPQFGSFKSLFEKQEWVIAESPYLIKDQILKNFIYVKAVDIAGNERIIKVKPRHLLPLYNNYLFWGIIVLSTIIFIVYKLWKKRKEYRI